MPLAESVRRFGVSLRTIQTGRVQQYMIMGVFMVVAFGILFYYLLFLA